METGAHGLLHALLHLLGGLLFLATLWAALQTEGRPVYLGAASGNGPKQAVTGSRSTPLITSSRVRA
jgi:hypothetical protein